MRHINFDEYKVTAEYPKPVSKRICQNCKVSVTESSKFCSECGVDLAALRAPMIKKYEEQKYEYDRESESKLDNFWIDAFAELGFKDEGNVVIPMSCIKRLAWDRGHSAGLHEVFGELEDLLAEAVQQEK